MPAAGLLLLSFGPAISAGRASAQPPRPATFQRATDVERQLPQSSVYEILEDSRGFLWFGTREGAARWDGYAMRVWRHDPFDAASLPGNVIRLLAEDREGSVWVVAHNYLDVAAGIARVQGPRLERVQRFDVPARHVAVDFEGNAYAITNDSVHRFDARRGAFTTAFARAARPRRAGTTPGAPRDDPTAPMLMRSAASRDGRLWIVDQRDGDLESCDPAAGVCRTVPWSAGGSTSRVTGGPFIDARGRLWIGTATGVAVLDPGTGRLERQSSLPDRGVVIDFTADPNERIWALSTAGVIESTADSLSRTHRLTTLANEPNLAPVTIRADRAGTIWVGTVWGLYRRQRSRTVFGHLEHDPRDHNSLSEGLVVSLAEDHVGDIWIGTIGGGLNRWNRRTGTMRRYRHDPSDRNSLSHDIVWALGVDSAGTVWAGTSSGLNRFDRRSNSFRRAERDPAAAGGPLVNTDNSITDLAIDGDGTIWLTCPQPCGNSLLRYDPRIDRFDVVDVPIERAGYIELDAVGDLWIGSQRGVRRLDRRAMTLLPLSDSGGGLDGVLAFHPGRRGDLWVGANSGLYRFSRTGTLLARYSAVTGLPGNAVFGILEDRQGRLWLSTNRGIVSLDPDGSGDARVYDHTTGIGNVEFNRNAYLRARDGTMFFGGDRGLTWFHPDSIELNAYRPPVVFTAVHRSTQQGTRIAIPVPGEPARVAPDDYTFAIEFAALNYVNPHRNQYAVQLVGFDRDWKPQGTVRRTTYTNVPPGRYQFRVRAANDDGIWNEAGAAIEVIVEPFFWQTLWFRVLLVLATASAVAGATWSVSRTRYRLALQRSLAAHALETERSRISRDMHDEVGASLTEIAILSELALRANGAGDPGEHLRRIGQKSRATLDSIGEIVWATDPQNDAGDRFVAHLREFAADYLESAELGAHLDFPSDSSAIRVTADFRRTVFLILKEAIANTARHAGASHVQVQLELDMRELRLRVTDDGVGFDPTGLGDRDSGHDGLRNMRQRAESLGGRFTVRSAPGQGTTIECVVPLGRPAPAV